MNTFIARAAVFCNQDFLCISTQSTGLLAYAEPSAKPLYLPSDVSDEILGKSIRNALALSKQVGLEEFQEIWKSGIIHSLDNQRDAWAMEKYGYKTKRAMYKNMLCCWISCVDEKLQVKPTHRKTLDTYSGISIDGPEILRIPEYASDAEVGAALREGFIRCT